MRTVKYRQRLFAKNLDPCGQHCLCKSGSNDLIAQSELFFEQTAALDNAKSVDYLVRSAHRQRVIYALVSEFRPEAVELLYGYRIDVGYHQSACFSLGSLTHDSDRIFRVFRTQNARDVLLDDACLLRSYLGDSLAEYRRVVEVYRRNDRQQGSSDDVGAVEQSAQPRFKHDNITFMLCKVHKRYCLSYLKLRKISAVVQIPDSFFHSFCDRRKLLIGNIFTIKPYPVVIPYYIRRCEAACFQSAFNKHPVEHLGY